MPMNIDFTNKVVLITGGSAGIGFACAQLFLELGAAVSICGTNQEKLEAALCELKQVSDKVYGQVCDVTNGESLRSFAEGTQNALGDIDVWVSNAGTCDTYDILKTPEEIYDHSFDTNVRSVYLGAKIGFEMMKDRGGVMLIASSFAALMPSVGSGLYAATKSAVSSMVKTLAAEMAPYGIRVNGYIPGVVDTAMSRASTAKDPEAMVQNIALRRIGEPMEVAYPVAFLASDYASYIDGTCLEISGGKFGVQNPAKAWENKRSCEG